MRLIVPFLVMAVAGCVTSVDDEELDVETSTIESDLVTTCPGVDTSAGVTTYKGLAGSYQRYGLPAVGEPLSIRFTTTKDDPDAAGWYSGTKTGVTGWPVYYAGIFTTIADNPAIGAALNLDTNNDGKLDQTFFVLGLAHAYGKVSGICLVGANAPFLLTRVGF